MYFTSAVKFDQTMGRVIIEGLVKILYEYQIQYLHFHILSITNDQIKMVVVESKKKSSVRCPEPPVAY